MHILLFSFMIVFSLSLTGCVAPAADETTLDEPPTIQRSLVELVNEYRQLKGLPAIPESTSLNMVAQAHVNDLQNNSPVGGSCNLHSWSDQGGWTPCCYTADHAQKACMWQKPAEITAEVYTGYGYEIATYTTGTMTTESALNNWINSPGHLDLILNRKTWQNRPWSAIGVATSEQYAVIWFGEEADPAGVP